MEQATKQSQKINNPIEITEGDTFKHFGVGDQNVDKRNNSEFNLVKAISIGVISLVVGTVLLWWIAKQLGFTPLILQ